MLARFAPKAPVGVRFWGRFWRRWGGVFASRAPRSAFSPVAHPREHPVASPASLRSRTPASIRSRTPASILRSPRHWAHGDVDLHPAETPEDELGLRPGGEGNYRGPLQTRDEVQSAMPARFAPKAPAAGCFWGRFRARFGSLVARRWVRLIVSPAAHRREYPVVFRGEELLPLPRSSGDFPGLSPIRRGEAARWPEGRPRTPSLLRPVRGLPPGCSGRPYGLVVPLRRLARGEAGGLNFSHRSWPLCLGGRCRRRLGELRQSFLKKVIGLGIHRERLNLPRGGQATHRLTHPRAGGNRRQKNLDLFAGGGVHRL